MHTTRLAPGLSSALWVLTIVLGGCAGEQLILPYTTAVPPMIMTPAVHAGVDDQRTRFREIFCTINEEQRREAQRKVLPLR